VHGLDAAFLAGALFAVAAVLLVALGVRPGPRRPVGAAPVPGRRAAVVVDLGRDHMHEEVLEAEAV
jgi:hypothetical protein